MWELKIFLREKKEGYYLFKVLFCSVLREMLLCKEAELRPVSVS